MRAPEPGPAGPDPPGFDEDRVHGRREDAARRRRPLSRRARRAEQEQADLAARVARPLRRSRRVVVASRKGGVGKTTMTLVLGHAFAAHRPDRVVAVDGDPDGGTLAHRVDRSTALHIGDLLAQVRDVHGYTAIRRFTVRTPSGLEVLATPADPAADVPTHASDYLRVIAKLAGSYGLVLLDTATGVLDTVTAGLLESADQLVLVSGPGIDEARASASTLDWLGEQGSAALVRDAVAVVNSPGPMPDADLSPILDHFAARCRAVCTVPFDPHLALGGVADPLRLAPATRDAILRVAAAVADGFALDGARRGQPRDRPLWSGGTPPEG